VTPASTPPLASTSAHEALREILDPEMPINIVDLGIVERVEINGVDVEVDLIPTFVGCPALDMLRNLVCAKLQALGAATVTVRFLNDPPWSVDRITDEGREALRAHGVTVPMRAASQLPAGPILVPLSRGGDARIACPYCGSTDTRMESAFGPTRCRTIYHCEACKNPFEHMKPI
jgi:ring-1,2-phenylacetyl-CoA epoxidase subunit PaaD